MELYQLKSFITVADTGNLTQASELLFTSQPAVSAHIKALEEEFEVQLFKRSPKGMTLTRNGEIIKAKALQVLETSQELKAEAAALKNELSGNIRIGLNADAQYLRLSDWHQYLLRHFPKLNVELVQGTSIKLLEDVASGKLDASFTGAEHKNTTIDDVRLLNGYAVVAAAPQWKKHIVNASVEELADLPWIQPESYCVYNRYLDELFASKKPNNITTTASEDYTINLIISGTGLSLIRDDQAIGLLKDEKIVVWEETKYPLPLNLSFNKKRVNDPIIQCLIDVIPRFFDPLQTIDLDRMSA